MANLEHIDIVKRGTKAIKRWRQQNPNVRLDLSGANFGGRCNESIDFCQYDYGVNLVGADIHGADFSNANLSLSDLSGANLKGTDLRHADLRAIELKGADLTNANIKGVMFCSEYGRRSNLTGAILKGACIPDETDSYFIELATVDGFFEIDFGEQSVMSNYLASAFDCVQKSGGTWSWKKFGGDFAEDFFVKENFKKINLIDLNDIKPPEIVIQTIEEVNAELIRYLSKKPHELYNLHPRKFEELIAEILASFGWQVNLTLATRDGGYDIFAISKDLSAGVQTSWLIECKKYAPERKVGVEIIRSLYGSNMFVGAANLMLATTSFFTKDVLKMKGSRYNLELRDYEGVLEWINAYRPNPNGKLYVKDSKLILPRSSL